MEISVVIPTYNRKENVLSLLSNLNNSLYPINEVIIVDSGNEKLNEEEYSVFKNLHIIYLTSVASVCVQRNIGIRAASSEWIFLCDDDIEVPEDYLQKINLFYQNHSEANAISGLVLQKENDAWTSSYPITSSRELLLKYIFGLGIWGTIACNSDNYFTGRIKKYYARKGNYIAKSGWPIITNFSGEYFIVPIFGLGASVIKKEWLLISPYDETLDRSGIGDNYGVAIGFPESKIYVLNDAFVFHHQEQTNRLKTSLQYYRRVLALEYFIQTKNIAHVKITYTLWSLFGNLLIQTFSRNKSMAKAAFKAFISIAFKKNPYAASAKQNRIITEPQL